ncbi:MAG: hypothetical protein ACTHN5_17650 [Phycisphaerae bacterium]
MHRSVIRHLSFVILSLGLSACHHTPKPPPPIIKTGIPVPSISIDAASGWTAAPVAGGTPLFTDNYYAVEFYPPALQGAILIQRQEAIATAGTWLDGAVTVPTAATLYIAVLCQNNDDRLVPDAQLHALANDGWTQTPGIFSSSQPDGQHWYWTVFSHPIPAGPVTLKSDAIEHPHAVFIIGKQR